MSGASPTPGNPFQRAALRRRWFFSMWDLMQFVLAAAIAVATGKNVVAALTSTYEALVVVDPFLAAMFESKWWLVTHCVAGVASALLAPTAALMALSMIKQAGHMFRQGRRTSLTSSAERFNWCFQWLGRIVLAFILLGCVLVDNVITAEKLGLGVSDEAILWQQDVMALRRAVLVLGIMACLGWNSISRRLSARRRPWQWLFSIMIVPLAAFWALAVWEDSSAITRLVHYAVLGVEMSGPLKFANPSISALPMHRVRDFCQVAGMTSIAAIIGACCCRILINSRVLRWHSRLSLAMLMVAGWAVQATFLHWVYWDGFYSLSPAWPHEIGLHYGHVAGTAFVLTVLLGAMIAYRGSVHPRENGSEVLTSPQKRWFHESRLALALITVGAAGQILPYVAVKFVTAAACLWMALLVFGVAQLWRRRAGRNPAAETAWYLPPGRFFASWLAAAVTLALAVPTLGLFSFVFWMGPVNWVLR